MVNSRFQALLRNPLRVFFLLGTLTAGTGAIIDIFKMHTVNEMFVVYVDIFYLISFTASMIIYAKNKSNIRLSSGIFILTLVFGFVITNVYVHVNHTRPYSFLQDTAFYIMILTVTGFFFSGMYVIILDIIYSATLIALWFLSGDKLGDINILFLLVIMTGYSFAIVLFPKKLRNAFTENEKLHALVAQKDKELLKKENQRIAREVKLLQETVEIKNRELVSRALILTGHKEKNARLAKKLKDIKTNQTGELNNIIHSLQTEDTVYWKEFRVRFNDVHQDFYTNIKADFPNLSTGELKLAAFIKLKLSSKEIAILTNTTKAGINVSRSRLRKKLKMDNKDNFIDFLDKY